VTVHGAADIGSEGLDIFCEGEGSVVEDFVCAEGLKVGMVLEGGEGDGEGGGVVQTGFLDGVDAHVCGGGVGEELFFGLDVRSSRMG